jgi:hypothetical protein
MVWQIGVDVGGTFTDLLALDPDPFRLRRPRQRGGRLRLTTRKRRFLLLDSAPLHVVAIPTRQHGARPRLPRARARSV